MMENGHCGTLFRQAPWKFLLDVFISLTKQSIKCPTAMRTTGKHCNKKKKHHISTAAAQQMTHEPPQHYVDVVNCKCILFHAKSYHPIQSKNDSPPPPLALPLSHLPTLRGDKRTHIREEDIVLLFNVRDDVLSPYTAKAQLTKQILK